jgi:dihydropteroate synthase
MTELKLDAHTYVMGIINITSDSFSGDGLLNRSDFVKLAVTQARQFVAQGAHILDIGAESTRPGASPVSAAQEMERVIPVVQAISAEALGVPISIDTYKASVAEAALHAGANWINDVWGLHADPMMSAVAAHSQSPLIIMHNHSKPDNAELQQRLGGHYVGIHYANLLEEVKFELMESVSLAHMAGVDDRHIILDPGIGFGKTVEQNLELINRLDEIVALGFPVLLGPSRKSFIGYTLNLPPEERIEGTAAAVAVGITRGAKIVRVHDVKIMSRIAAMTDAILHNQRMA